MIPSTSLLEVYDKTSDFPDQIVEPLAFSPLQEMLHSYIWRLMCDQVLSVGTVQARKFLALYIERGEIALNADSYFGAKLHCVLGNVGGVPPERYSWVPYPFSCSWGVPPTIAVCRSPPNVHFLVPFFLFCSVICRTYN
jgi:hypothetical protein